MGNKKLTIITISKSDIPSLEVTLESLHQQEEKNYSLILVLADFDVGAIDTILDKYDLPNVSVILDDGLGIFQAMNTGLNKCQSAYALFLNGGDRLIQKTAVARIISEINNNTQPTNIAFNVVQEINDEKFQRLAKHKKRLLDFRYFPPPHQGFIALLDKNIIFKRRYGNSADTYWIFEQIDKMGCRYICDYDLSSFSLGGISNNPSKISIDGVNIKSAKSILKFCMFWIVGLQNYYIITSWITGYKRLNR
mgnify:CR=1 FL=1|tara:strand:- start:8688 stop:9440 length:753 start_codon:yes stop_codon:yes gene_type:complete